ncbi:MAG TPA: type IV pilus secretin PilQ [Anaeromyxobacter sp.]|nr:type IV pilus secretin PilQ [Anaeromyxobacter sp.]
MISPVRPFAGLLLWGALVGPGLARSADANVIRSIDVSERDGALELTVLGSRPPSYSVFKLQDPPRLVIDLSGADVSALPSPRTVGKAGVVSVVTAQYQDARSSVGRVIVTLDGTPQYEVLPRGDAVVVRVGESLKAAAPAAAAASAVPSAPPPAAPSPAAEPALQKTANAEPGPSAPPDAAQKPTPTAADDHVVNRRVDEGRPGGRLARAVTGVEQRAGRVVLATDGEVGSVEILELRDPARLVLDLQGVERAPRSVQPLHGPFSQIRFGKADGRVRVVLDAAGALPVYAVKRVGRGLEVSTAAVAEAPKASSPAAVAEAPKASSPAAVVEAPKASSPAAAALSLPASEKAEPAARPTRITAVRFSGKGDTARIEVDGKARYSVNRPDERTVVLTLEGAQLSQKLERSLDTTAFKGPVQMVSSFNQPSSGQVRIVASLREAASDEVADREGGLSWSFRGSAAGPAEAEAEKPVRIEASGAEAAGFSSEAPGYAVSGAPQARGYTGRRITLDFHDIDIRNLLRLIADVSKKNILVADDVKGKVTVSLRNIPWDQALDLVLRAKGLGKEEIGNVIRVAKLDALAAEQQARAAAEQARIPLQPLKVRLIPVNFSTAKDLAPRVKDVLTERGTVSVDDRTNVLIVKDIPEALVRAEGLVRNLDAETPQILIESRIVEASTNYNRSLGIQWGGTAGMTQALGNPTGLVFPNNATATGGSGGGPTTGTAGTPNYAVNLPAAIGQGSGGGIGFTFGSVGGAFNLNLRLSALENTGIIKTISAPRIATVDNKEAKIGQGVSIPFSQTSASGVNTTFIEAKLELTVTPHVSPDGSVLLKIKATNNAPNPQLTGANGQPSISKREAETEVLVKDGDTTVIGGIYTRQTSMSTASVPWLGKIPVLGYFFRTTTKEDDHTELLIFITPRILNRSAATVANGNQ